MQSPHPRDPTEPSRARRTTARPTTARPDSPRPDSPRPDNPGPRITGAARGGDQTARQLLAVALMFPALLALTYSYVRPTVWTAVTAFQSRRLLNRAPEWVGLANFQRIFGAGWLADAGYALSYALVPVAALMTFAPLLAWLTGHTGTGGRRIVLVTLAVPLAGLTPVAAAAAWRHTATGGAAGFLGSDPRIGYWLFAGVIAVAATATAGVMVHSRGRGPDGRRWPATAVLLAVAVLAAIAAALQEFTFPWFAAAPAGTGTDVAARGPAAAVVRATTTGFDLGDGAAAATALLVPVLGLGSGAALLVVLSRLRVHIQTEDEHDRPRWWGIAGADVILLALAAGFGCLAWTVIAAWGGPPDDLSGYLVSGSWWAPLPRTVLGVGFAAAAGLAIGALRPLGEHSEWLLLLFAPWLFVGAAPLLVASFADALGRIGTAAAVTPTSWLSIPAVFVFTLFFGGVHRQWERLRRSGLDRKAAARATYVRFGLPAVLVVTVMVWLVRAQTLAWPLVAGDGQVGTAATLAAQTVPPQRPWLAPLLLPAAVALAAFVAAQLHLTRRLSLHAGDNRQVDS